MWNNAHPRKRMTRRSRVPRTRIRPHSTARGTVVPDASVAIRSAEREQRPVRARLVDRARERRPREQPRAIREHVREPGVDPVRPVGIEEERRGRAVGEAELRARGPFAIRERAVEPFGTRSRACAGPRPRRKRHGSRPAAGCRTRTSAAGSRRSCRRTGPSSGPRARRAGSSGIKRTGPGWRTCRYSMITLASTTVRSPSTSTGHLAQRPERRELGHRVGVLELAVGRTACHSRRAP